MMPSVARIGDMHICPKRGHGATPIVSGGTAVADGRAVARVGDKTGCGATIIEGSSVASNDGKAISYVGCKTDHGGVIVSGSPSHTVKP